ncbi:hypothetical protein ODJ79_29955 [Actinoplanes sp. KI2]|uniref:hypothetical protein n=1 Tax=Actinoplanes sp. KI2 TaxID=2983315 RepID=UPI0021D5CEDC|nr:hypothetical protein [Actinoplanes sp. KI2]MCU7727963.1 hypothetical protein [Actinoplanes sp. KI2]
MPAVGDLFTDMRGGDRRMRVSYHEGPGVVVVSLWADTVCRGTFQLATGDVARLVALLSQVERSAGDLDSPANAQAEAATRQPATPSPEQTGDVSRAALPAVRTPRVA